jgi:carnosine N-methyltransferase
MNQRWQRLRKLAKENDAFISLLIRNHRNIFENWKPQSTEEQREILADGEDREKTRSTLQQFVREWSSVGKEERDACFQPLISALEHYLPVDKNNRFFYHFFVFFFFL